MLGELITNILVLILGYAYPAFECFKTLEKHGIGNAELRFWCEYWVIIAILTVLEKIVGTFISWVPMYGETKLAFIIYLWYPKTMGTRYVYNAMLWLVIARHKTSVERRLLEMRTRAWDLVMYYWYNVTELGQSTISGYLASESSRPRSKPHEGLSLRSKLPSSSSLPSSIAEAHEKLPLQPKLRSLFSRPSSSAEPQLQPKLSSLLKRRIRLQQKVQLGPSFSRSIAEPQEELPLQPELPSSTPHLRPSAIGSSLSSSITEASSVSWHEVSDRVSDAALNLRISRSTASSSSSSSDTTLISSSRLANHDVYVSFKRVDVDKTFVDHIHSTLLQKGIHAYMEDETFLWGEPISPSRIKVIRESPIFVIIFSKNYAKSRLCLNELAYVMETKDEIGQIVVPIFYGVEPSDVRHQQGEFGESFATHESNVKADKWRKALWDATHLSSWTENDVMNRAEFIKTVVDTISRRLLPSISSDKPCQIGLNSRIQDLKAQLQVGIGGVHMVGITGIWGSGKSTLASSIYDEICHEFDGCCFIKNVRAQSRLHGLKKLQEKILSKVLKHRNVDLVSIEEGIFVMRSKLGCISALIVLDDVDHLDQLKMLAGSEDWFGEGSRIIIVTRNKDLLTAHNINIIYNVRLLSDEEAIELFSMHAFGERSPVKGYEKLTLDMVYKFDGHPSSLVSLGSFLRDKDMSEWTSTSAKLEDIPDDETMELFRTGDDGVQSSVYSWLGS